MHKTGYYLGAIGEMIGAKSGPVRRGPGRLRGDPRIPRAVRHRTPPSTNSSMGRRAAIGDRPMGVGWERL